MLSRRDLLKASAVVGVGGILSAATAEANNSQSRSRPERVLRFAYLTDSHLPTRGHTQDLKSLLDKVQGPEIKAQMVVFGGDNIFSASGVSRPDAEAQLSVFRSVIRSEVNVPSACVLGNHDVWGWREPQNGWLTGKRLAVESYGMPGRYYSFVRAGWKFIALDSVHFHRATGYTASIDPEQFAWLAHELKSDVRPTIIFSHVPLMSVTYLGASGTSRHGGGARISHQMLVGNSREVIDLFRTHSQVKMVLSGHVHMSDSCRFRGVEHVCCGAVSGGWWKGDFEGFGPLMTIVDLFSDGRAFSRTVSAKV
ncbi:MAG: metallophosphoesterase [Fimbriimonadaceae bacterium]|jgi:3',5'-cyclic AMP phosphodiesterase CpdA|nr:metallophosphoesterase [Fimbriimonadaceae bacterium]